MILRKVACLVVGKMMYFSGSVGLSATFYTIVKISSDWYSTIKERENMKIQCQVWFCLIDESRSLYHSSSLIPKVRLLLSVMNWFSNGM